MHFSLPALEVTADLSRLRAEVRAFAEDQRRSLRFSPVSSGWMVFNREFSRSCGAAGYVGIAWPRADGGAGKTQIERYVVAEELLAAGAPLGAHWITDRQSGPQIIKHGTESLRRELLPRMVRGEVCFAIGMSEPDSGSDLASIRSFAAKEHDGWRLNGRKIWTTNGHLADYMIGLFRTQPRTETARHQGMTQFVVDLTALGVSRRPIEDLAGGEDFSEVTFDDVFVPTGMFWESLEKAGSWSWMSLLTNEAGQSVS
jgi:alkylation response protein AidB-like acyl-CoA dehydrogenase